MGNILELGIFLLVGIFKLLDMNQGDGLKWLFLNGEKYSLKFMDFKNYIDVDKGWIIFEGVVMIICMGVNFVGGQIFFIFLDEIDVMDEFGKGNYGIVYKVCYV